MTTAQAANQGLKVYQLAIKRKQDTAEAYIKGLDFIIDKVYSDEAVGTTTLKAIRLYERKVGV